EDACLELLRDPEPDLRRLAAGGLALNCKRGDRTAHAELLRVLGDDQPAVRRALFLALGQVNGPGAADNPVNGLEVDDGRAVCLRDGLVRAIERTGQPGVEALLALAESGVQKDSDRVVEVFTGLRTAEAAAALPALLRHPHLGAGQRAALVRSYGNYLLEPPV